METKTNQSAPMTTTNPSMQSGAFAVGRGVEATEEQARAIISTAKRAVEEATKTTKTRADDGATSAAGKLSPSSSSLKRSLECFLEGRKNKKKKKAPSSVTTPRRRLEASTASSSPSSPLSSSSSSN